MTDTKQYAVFVEIMKNHVKGIPLEYIQKFRNKDSKAINVKSFKLLDCFL